MTDSHEIDRELAEIYERLALLHRKRAGSARGKPRKVTVAQPDTMPSRAAIDSVRRGLRRKGIVA